MTEPSEMEKNFVALSLVPVTDLTVDGTLEGELDPDKVDAFYAAIMGISVSELREQDTE